MFLGEAVLKICSKLTGEHPCRSAITISCKATVASICMFLSWVESSCLFAVILHMKTLF